MSNQSCGKRRHWIYYRDIHNQWTGKIHRMGACSVPQPDSSDHNPLSDMAETEGKTCQCFQAEPITKSTTIASAASRAEM